MDVGCCGVISDHLRDYCCQVGCLEFQHLDADFSTSETCFTDDKFKQRCSKSGKFACCVLGQGTKRDAPPLCGRQVAPKNLEKGNSQASADFPSKV